ASADADPHSQAVLGGRKHAYALERRSSRALPGHGLARSIVGQQLREESELFLEQDLVLRERKSEERERFGERAAPENDFSASIGRCIERREPLEYANWIVRAQDGHSRAESNALRASGDRGEKHFGCGDREIGAMVFADADEVRSNLI